MLEQRQKDLMLRLLLLITLLLIPLQSEAARYHSDRKLSYPYKVVWPTIIRFVRVDQNWEILESDPDVGYVKVHFKHEKTMIEASLEVVPIQDQFERDAVHVFLNTEENLGFFPAEVLDAFAYKVRREQGPPPSPRPSETAPEHEKPKGRKLRFKQRPLKDAP